MDVLHRLGEDAQRNQNENGAQSILSGSGSPKVRVAMVTDCCAVSSSDPPESNGGI